MKGVSVVIDGWHFGVVPEGFGVRFKDARYAVVLVMAGDGDLGSMLDGDFFEMASVVNEDVAVLALVDYPRAGGERGSWVLEVLPGCTNRLAELGEICTGDPRPLADFFARALVSFSRETMIAIGFWGHGSGVFGDFDPKELALDRGVRFGRLGAQITEAAIVAPLVARGDGSRAMLPDETSKNVLTNREASSALAVAFSRAGRFEPVDMLFFDTCLNGSVEVFTELRGFAKTFVASSLLIPGTGWNYQYWLGATIKERPATAEDWAVLAVSTYGAAYDQRTFVQPAQLAAISTGVDFVGAFGALVRGLVGQGEVGLELMAQASRNSQSIVYGENLDFYQLIYRMGSLTEDKEILDLAKGALDAYQGALLGLSMPPAGGEDLSGMTIWCPVEGDRGGVSRYYGGLEFDRLTGWMTLLSRGSKRSAEGQGYSMIGFLGLELIRECEVAETRVSENPNDRRLWIRIPDGGEAATLGLVAGEYGVHGGVGSMEFPTYVALREFVRGLLALRKGDEFEALRGCCDQFWVISARVCASLVRDFDCYEEAYRGAHDGQDVELYDAMRMVLRRAARGGVVVFW